MFASKAGSAGEALSCSSSGAACASATAFMRAGSLVEEDAAVEDAEAFDDPATEGGCAARRNQPPTIPANRQATARVVARFPVHCLVLLVLVTGVRSFRAMLIAHHGHCFCDLCLHSGSSVFAQLRVG